MKKVFSFFALALLAFGSLRMNAADNVPAAEALGIGVVANTYYGIANNLGGVVSYNVSNNLQAGLKVGFTYSSVQGKNTFGVEESISSTNMLLGPFVRYYLENIKSLRPFVDAGLEIGTYQKTNGDYTYMRINLGGEWNPYKTFGVIGGFCFFNYESNQKSMQIGLGYPFIGATWYFN